MILEALRESDKMSEREFIDKILELGEKFFNTEKDPTQIPVTRESVGKLAKLHPKAFIWKTDENGEPASWSVVVPTTRKLMDEFLAKRITERQLFDMTEPAETYEAIYLCAVFTVPEQRGKGYAFDLITDAIASVPLKGERILFSWPISIEGEVLAKKIGDYFKVNVLMRM